MQGIRIQDLFGHFNYEIILSEDGMTIITGPNGFGKSTIIQCLNALANSDVEYFFKLDFSEIIRLSAAVPTMLCRVEAPKRLGGVRVCS